MADQDKKEIVAEARRRFRRAYDYYSTSRKLAAEDTRFALGDSDNGWQWPEKIKASRDADSKVCLTVNVTAQHCNQIINNIRQNRPSVKVSPVDSGADKETATILGGLIRNIQVSSASDDAHDTAAEHAVYGGEGYWRIVTEYETPESFNQVIVIKPCPNPNLVLIDPDCQALDKSDASWGFVFEDIPVDQCKREHPGIDPADWVERDGEEWWSDETIRRAEYFWCDYVKDKACLLSDGSTTLKSKLEPGSVVVKERDTVVKKWHWCKLVGGHEEPLDEREWLGDYLPIVSVVGKEIIIDGEVVRKGIVRDLKDQGRMINFAYSETVQTLALQNKIPYMAAAEAIEGHEDEWDTANLDNRAYLTFNAYDDSGNPLPKPERQQPAVMPAAQIQLLQLSTEQMRAASGQQNANFGIKSEAASGVGIQRLKAQGEVATFHFPDNLARALRHEAKILIDLIQKYYDTPRVIRVLGLDGKEDHAKLDPEMQGAYHESQTIEGKVEKIFNPLVGRYDVTIDTGPNYHTQRQEGAERLNELASRVPQMMQVAGDLIMRAQDFPMAEQLADRLEKTLPPPLRDQKPGQMQIPPEVEQQMQQMGEQMQQMQLALQDAGMKLQEAEQGSQKEILDAQVEAHKADLAAMERQKKMEDEAQASREKMAIDAQLRREQMELDALLALEKAEKERQTRLIIAQMETKEEPEEPEEPEDEVKTISITTPSGGVYSGVVRKGAVEIMSPTGAIYTGTTQ